MRTAGTTARQSVVERPGSCCVPFVSDTVLFLPRADGVGGWVQEIPAPDAVCSPRDAAAWVVQECEATQRAEGVCSVGFGVWLARDAAFEGLAWVG